MPSRKQAKPRSLAQVALNDRGPLGTLNRQSLALERLNHRLERIVPQDLAGRFNVTAIRDHTLIIGVESPAWASRVRYVSRQILDLASKLTDKPLTDVRIRVVPPSLVRTKKPKARNLSTQASEHLRRASSVFDDPEMQASLKRLAQRTGREE